MRSCYIFLRTTTEHADFRDPTAVSRFNYTPTIRGLQPVGGRIEYVLLETICEVIQMESGCFHLIEIICHT